MNSYRNGNYFTFLDPKTGTKMYRALRDDEDFSPEFPDNIDIKLTNLCYRNCAYCHESSHGKGKEGDLNDLFKVIESSLPPYPIELSFGGGSLSTITYKKLIKFIEKVKRRGHMVSITIRHKTPISSSLLQLVDYIGVSVDDLDDKYENRPPYIPINKTVLHLVLGTFNISDLGKFLKYYEALAGKDELRILFLGFKRKGRGEDYPIPNDWFDNFRRWLLQHMIHRVKGDLSPDWNISFDNLAIEQLRLRDAICEDEWKKRWMGQENSHSMYIDAVEKTFGPSSASEVREPWEKYNNSITEYFKSIKRSHD